MNNIRSLRSALRLSQAELAKHIGITQSALSHYENGSCDPLVATARRLISFARGRGLIWRLEDVYAAPDLVDRTDATDDVQPPAGTPDRKEAR
ncbi:helix-turn-helix transcriptional regulator [Burkholderia cenocepacia]|jgi:putative transcriptional regulator|uniref:helix-turn-helix transcriptional regulator n=1 Tax=Burkholderia cenocepacia TaxID=95486 RepID=UPI0007C64BF0|nr:helix-turn-helix transcriptional regulator [Burkholderia cenocepacia]MEB2544049.1 helix-turn-helix transcriptional regulator [Burkholderia cenocepacia]DAH71610.1 MAG TPA: helix-turn-helix domain protein [Caudoviricetes sp.]